MLYSHCASLDNETRSNEGCDRSGQSASFHCVFRSDDEVRRVLEALQNREKKDLSNEELNASDSEGSICSVESVCSAAAGVCDSERLPFNGSCVSLNCNPGSGGGPYSVTSKREHFSTGPLSVTPSRKRKKNEGHFDPTLGSTDDISPRNTTSNSSQVPKTCVPTTRSAAATSNRSSDSRSSCCSSSNRSTGYAFTPQQDEKILRAVEYFTRNGLQSNNVWRSLSCFMKTTDESVKERWIQLDAKKRAEPKVKVPEKTIKHTRDRKRASNGNGLSALPADNLSSTTVIRCSSNVAGSDTRLNSSGITRPHRTRSVANATTKSGTISSAREETLLYMNIERYTHAEDQHILDFVAKQEQDGVCMQETWNILSHALSRRADCVRARWLKLSSNTSLNIQETTSSLTTNVFDSASSTSNRTSNSWDFIDALARSDTSILTDFNWSEATQASDNERIFAADVDIITDMQSYNCSSHAGSCILNTTASTRSNRGRPTSSTSSRNTKSRFTAQQDEKILRAVEYSLHNGLPLSNVWLGLSSFMKKTAASVEERWRQLDAETRAKRKIEESDTASHHTRNRTSSWGDLNTFGSASAAPDSTSNACDFINVFADTHSITAAHSTLILADFNWSEATQASGNEHNLAADVHADSYEPNSTVTDTADINSTTLTSSTLNTADNIFVSTSTLIMQAFMSIFRTSHSKGTDNSMESATGNACTHHSNTNDDNNSIVQVCNEVPPSPAQHISPAADSIDLAQSPLQSNSSVGVSISVGSVSSNGLFVTYYGLDNDDSNYW